MRTSLRVIGNFLLGVLAIVGVLSAGTWAATAAGWIQPVIVMSGSMEPGIMTGDLLIDRPVATDDVEVGDVITVPSELTGSLVTHRVVEIDHAENGGATIRLQGDANDREDVAPYEVGAEVIAPSVQISGGGAWLMMLRQPGVIIGLLVAAAASIGLTMLPPQRPATAADDKDDADTDRNPDADPDRELTGATR